jgi:hypothetical protein
VNEFNSHRFLLPIRAPPVFPAFGQYKDIALDHVGQAGTVITD